MGNPLLEVQRHGQSIWYDFIRRNLITSGELQTLIDQDGLRGVTSNPAIFEKALAGSPDYDQALAALILVDHPATDATAPRGGAAKELYERLAIEDIQLAADVLHPVHRRTDGVDGFVSLEVSPYLADDTDATVAEGLRLHRLVGRPNVMIKVPATTAGLPAITRLVADGVPVNVTLLFSVARYREAAAAYLDGLEQRLAAGDEIAGVASVASVFLSRIDAAVDRRLAEALDATDDKARRGQLKELVGKVAIANARVAYAALGELLESERWQRLAASGARPQRLLWASTSTKNPAFPDTMYVDELIGPHTVNTLPVATYEAFRARGTASATLVDGAPARLAAARAQLESLSAAGIDLDAVTDELLTAGVRKFSTAFDRLLAVVERKRSQLLGTELGGFTMSLGRDADDVALELDAWRARGKVRRLWRGDSSLWSATDEDRWLGWLHLASGPHEHLEQLQQIADDVSAAGFRHAVVLGMGGSSLYPDVLRQTFPRRDGFPALEVLDSVVPDQIRALEARIDLGKAVFVVASKSGSTKEPNSLYRHFRAAVEALGGSGLGGDRPGAHFIAVTDPGSSLHKLAKADGFRHIALGLPSVGGRFSALSNFGLVPAALAGIDTAELLERTEIMVQSCAPSVPPEVNPGVALGVALGTLASRAGRDKMTLVSSPGLAALGGWLEQLVAESTGKRGHGIIPIDGENLDPTHAYGSDRVFVYTRLRSAPDPDQDAAIDALRAADHPVLQLDVDEPMDIGQELFRWEIATAAAGAVLGINPFDQPDVEAAKIATRRLADEFEETGRLPAVASVLEADGLAFYAAADDTATYAGREPEAAVRAHLRRAGERDYFAINAFVEMSDANDVVLQATRNRIHDRKQVATTLGYGPRFLHSTGQLHKGGPASGVFLVITADAAPDLPIPGERLSFGALTLAQGLGDFEVLVDRGRRALRIHLGADVAAGLAKLRALVERALR